MSTKGKHWKVKDTSKMKLALMGNTHGFQKGKRNKNWNGFQAEQKEEKSRRWKGAPSVCENCGTTDAKKYEWANADHSYKRVLEDYIRLCTKCHRRYDYQNNKKRK